jgi:hypothetical protein
LATATLTTEEFLENIAHIAEATKAALAATKATLAATIFKGGMAVLVIGGARLLILEDLIGLRDLLELLLRRVIAGVYIWVIFFCKLTVSRF